MHRGQVDADMLGDVANLAAELDVVELVDDHDARLLRGVRRAVELERHRDGDDFIEVHAREVHVDHVVAHEAELKVLDEARLGALALDLEVEHVQAPLEGSHGDLLVDVHGERVASVAIDDGRETARGAKALRVAAAVAVALQCLDGGDFLCHCVYSDSEKG